CLPLYDKKGGRFDILKQLKRLRGTQMGDWPCDVRGEEIVIAGRVCAIKKSKIATELAQKKVIKEARKDGHQAKPETLMAAGYIFVFTTMRREVMTTSSVLEMYRGRWQIELAFKRLKSIIGLGHLPKQDPAGARAWIHGKIFASFLIETLIMAGELFFPWGYPLQEAA
ncbi:MAG: transposase, partial [Deltaproteobacteria bacterium]|nr:transposase [Deltaproteobacteria bacterium]